MKTHRKHWDQKKEEREGVRKHNNVHTKKCHHETHSSFLL